MATTQEGLVTLRRVDGLDVTELFVHCQPPSGIADAGRQADAMYSALADALEASGGGFDAVVSETVFMRDMRFNLEPVRTARQRCLSGRRGAGHRPAMSVIEQPPLNDQACLEVMVQAVLPREATPRIDTIAARSECGCADCVRAHGLRVRVGNEARVHAGGLCGAGGDAHEQTLGMFALAEDLLRQAGMGFRDVLRTWIYFRDIDRDYGDFNRARRAFFEAHGIDPVPASTGIGGGPISEAHDLCLGLYAVKADRPLVRTVMSSPTLNEAPQYGADFVRGMRVAETNKIALHVSGTASIDEQGNTAHVGDFQAQADRMLVNVAALLEGQGAGFGDVVYAITYARNPADAPRLRQKLREAGFEGFPNAMVVAPICRRDLLCEIELQAVLPSRLPGNPEDSR
jgi:enamine deaminase RidA (YjgF/YER057c/UK114 family)